jgi:hypothetical protein
MTSGLSFEECLNLHTRGRHSLFSQFPVKSLRTGNELHNRSVAGIKPLCKIPHLQSRQGSPARLIELRMRRV